MYGRRVWAGYSAHYVVLGEILKLRINIGIIHAIDNLILSNIVLPDDGDASIKTAQQLP